jgi:hypothetical protein
MSLYELVQPKVVRLDVAIGIELSSRVLYSITSLIQRVVYMTRFKELVHVRINDIAWNAAEIGREMKRESLSWQPR